jgi:hypothetical protein
MEDKIYIGWALLELVMKPGQDCQHRLASSSGWLTVPAQMTSDSYQLDVCLGIQPFGSSIPEIL